MGKFEKSRIRKEEAELVETFNQVAGSGKKSSPSKKSTAQKKSAPKKKNNKGAIIAICIAAAFVLIGIATGLLYYFFYTGDDGLILPNVSIAGIDVGGMTQEEAVNVLHLSTDSTYSQKDMVLNLPGEEIHLSPSNTKVQLNVEEAVAFAYQYGRTGTKAEQRKARQDAEKVHYIVDLLPYLNLNTDYIQSVMDEVGVRYNTTLTQPTVTVTGERPSLEPGEINPDAPKQILTVTLGIPESALDTTQLYGEILDAYNTNQFSVSMDLAILQPEKPDLKAIYKEYCVDPVDASLDTNTYAVIPEVYGYGFDMEAVQQQLDQLKNGESLEITLDYLEPAITSKDISSTLFQDELAFCEAYQASGYNRATNLDLACKAINGKILKPGETFSYNDTLGKRTAEKGYLGAAAYVGGETVTELGGGICQVSSALYYCTLYADLEVVERYCHLYPSSYVPLGMDATVSWGLLDYKFKNNTNYPIKIIAEASDSGRVKIWFMGTDEKDYYVKMSYSVLKTHEWKEVIKEITPEKNEKGYKDGEVITSPYTGYDVNTYKSKYNKETNELISTEFEVLSEYSKRDKVVCKIIKEDKTEPTVPDTTTPDVTDPPVSEPTDPPVSEPTDPPVSEPTDPPSEPTTGGIDGVVGEG